MYNKNVSDFKIIKSPLGGYVILAPKRAKRPDEATGFVEVCPFCIGNETTENEVFRIGGIAGDSNWRVRVDLNKFPFAPIHEIIIHSPDHHKNFEELPREHVQTIFEAYVERYAAHKSTGTVFIFSNRGEQAGESLPHPHSQLVVLPNDIVFELPSLHFKVSQEEIAHEEKHFKIICPFASQWPDEVWIVPNTYHKTFGQITREELLELSFLVQRLIQIFTLKHGHEFPFNFYIFPKEHWYLRFIPREKKLGGLEIVSNVFVNTGDPKETVRFIKEKF